MNHNHVIFYEKFIFYNSGVVVIIASIDVCTENLLVDRDLRGMKKGKAGLFNLIVRGALTKKKAKAAIF